LLDYINLQAFAKAHGWTNVDCGRDAVTVIIDNVSVLLISD